MGDLTDMFHSRPLQYGGPAEASLTMVHPYPQVEGSSQLADSGLWLGGDFGSAQSWVDDGEGSSLRFRFFLNRIRWSRGQLATEVRRGKGPGQFSFDQPWIPVRCSADLVL